MADKATPNRNPESNPLTEESISTLISSYVGVSFAVFLALLPPASLGHVASLQSRNRILSVRLFQAEDALRQLRARRREDARANARVAEIFAGHRHAWQQEEKRLLRRLAASTDELAALRAAEAELKSTIARLERELAERDELLELVAQKEGPEGKEQAIGEEGLDGDLRENEGYCGDSSGVERGGASEKTQGACFVERNVGFDGIPPGFYGQQMNGFGKEFFQPPPVPAAAKEWTDRSSGGWQDIQYDSVESMYHMKPFIARRESPWKIDGESTGVSSKLKLLEQELINLEKVGKGDLVKVSSSMRKQARRYQSLAGKIDDLCKKMQLSDPCEPTLSPEFRTQRQTEFLFEAFRLQHRATETGQKLTALQAEATKSHLGEELVGQAKLSIRRSLDSIRNNFKEIQRNLEIWLARIMGDVEGILARDGASRVRDYYLSRYPFVR